MDSHLVRAERRPAATYPCGECRAPFACPPMQYAHEDAHELDLYAPHPLPECLGLTREKTK